LDTTDIILHESIKIIKQNIGNGIKNIYVVGSRANKESATFSYDSNDDDLIYTSDLELFIDVKLGTYFKLFFTNYSNRISNLINKKIISLGYNSHVSITIKPLYLSFYFDFFKANSVFLYEFVPL